MDILHVMLKVVGTEVLSELHWALALVHMVRTLDIHTAFTLAKLDSILRNVWDISIFVSLGQLHRRTLQIGEACF